MKKRTIRRNRNYNILGKLKFAFCKRENNITRQIIVDDAKLL